MSAWLLFLVDLDDMIVLPCWTDEFCIFKFEEYGEFNSQVGEIQLQNKSSIPEH